VGLVGSLYGSILSPFAASAIGPHHGIRSVLCRSVSQKNGTRRLPARSITGVIRAEVQRRCGKPAARVAERG
jgi:hypothetical protein